MSTLVEQIEALQAKHEPKVAVFDGKDYPVCLCGFGLSDVTFVEHIRKEITPILAAAREQEQELAALKEPIVRSLNELHPLYYVRHPDDSYSVADPQPTEMPVNLSWPPVVSYSAGAPAGTVSSLEESHGFVTAVPDPQGRTIASGAAHAAYMMNKAKEEEQHSADLREARAGMREACAKHRPFWQGLALVCSCGKWTYKSYADKEGTQVQAQWEEHIRSLPDLAADEAIERIKAEAERKGRLEEAKFWHDRPELSREAYVLNCPGCLRIAALSGKET